MPILTLTTNQTISQDQRAAILEQISSFVATLLDKPIEVSTLSHVMYDNAQPRIHSLLDLPSQYVLVTAEFGKDAMFGGTTEPAALVHLSSAGNIGGELNAQYSPNLSAKIGSLVRYVGPCTTGYDLAPVSASLKIRILL